LEEVNVKKAINRYGTLPKGARIGAYLDSLRQDQGGGGDARNDSHPEFSKKPGPGPVKTKPIKQVSECRILVFLVIDLNPKQCIIDVCF